MSIAEKEIMTDANRSIITNNQPLITIVIPSFNQGNYIEKTLLSVFYQDYANKEIFVIDGGSTDKTLSVIKQHENKIDYWVSENDHGQANAINKGFARASGKYFYWINSDDILLPGAIARSVRTLEAIANPIKLSYGKRYCIDEHDKIIDIGLPPKRLRLSHFLIASWIPQETAFFSRVLWEKLGGLDESFQFALDYDLFVRAFLARASFNSIDDFLGTMRFHSQCKSCNPQLVATQRRECKSIQEKIIGHNPGFKIWQIILKLFIGKVLPAFPEICND